MAQTVKDMGRFHAAKNPRATLKGGGDLGAVVQRVGGHVDDEVCGFTHCGERTGIGGFVPTEGDLYGLRPQCFGRAHAGGGIGGHPRGIGDADAKLSGLKRAGAQLMTEQGGQIGSEAWAIIGAGVGDGSVSGGMLAL
ncbi:hypothetical protein [Nioella sp.]|uniref:hypothetical protein n=1 Tax=Nioella sp. TaxID=1912091 RepID=UPI003A88ED0D